MRLAEGNFVGCLGDVSHAVASVSLIIMTVLGAIDLISTKFLNLPFPGAFEAIESLMVLAVFLALAGVQARRQHIVVDIVIRRVSPFSQRVFKLVSDFLSLTLFFFIAWQGWVMASRSWAIRESSSGLIHFPIYPSKFALAVGASLMALQCVKDLIGGLEARSGHDSRVVPARKS